MIPERNIGVCPKLYAKPTRHPSFPSKPKNGSYLTRSLQHQSLGGLLT